jgi:hypothetical protein
MRRARTYLASSGATVVRFLVDPPARHGGLLRNAGAVERALADFARLRARG